MLGQRVAAESLYRAVLGELHNPQQISLQVRPTELRFAGMILQVRAETVAAQHALKDGSQQTDQHFAAAGGRHRVDHVPRRHESPQEALRAVGPPARLVHVQYGFILPLPFQFLARGGHRLAGFFPALLRTPQTDLDAQHLPQQRLHHPTRHTAHHRQIGDQRRQLGAEVPQGFLWHPRPRALAALGTDYPMALIFDDASLDGGQLGHLMPLHRAGGLHLLDLRRQGLAAMRALLWQQGPNLVDSFGGHQRPMRSAMAGLSPRLPPALLPPAPLARRACQSIGGRWLGRVRGVLFAQRQLTLQVDDLLLSIRDLPLLLRDLLGQPVDLLILIGQLPAQPFDFPFQIARPRMVAPRTHPPYSSRSRVICPAKSTRVLELLQKGVVTLAGHVAAEGDKSQAESIAKSIAGGQVVANQIAVVLTGAESNSKTVNADLDTGIEKNLDAALIRNKLHKSVKYAVKNAAVTLTGE